MLVSSCQYNGGGDWNYTENPWVLFPFHTQNAVLRAQERIPRRRTSKELRRWEGDILLSMRSFLPHTLHFSLGASPALSQCVIHSEYKPCLQNWNLGLIQASVVSFFSFFFSLAFSSSDFNSETNQDIRFQIFVPSSAILGVLHIILTKI